MNSVQSYFEEFIKRVPKLYGVLVTDKDGVALVRATGDVLNELQFDPTLSSSFTSTAEQSGKLSLGFNLSLISYFDNYTLIQINLLPLVVTLLAATDANVQLIQNCMPEIARVLEPVRQSVQQTVLQASREEQ